MEQPTEDPELAASDSGHILALARRKMELPVALRSAKPLSFT